jgi:hypothetical protein
MDASHPESCSSESIPVNEPRVQRTTSNSHRIKVSSERVELTFVYPQLTGTVVVGLTVPESQSDPCRPGQHERHLPERHFFYW